MFLSHYTSVDHSLLITEHRNNEIATIIRFKDVIDRSKTSYLMKTYQKYI